MKATFNMKIYRNSHSTILGLFETIFWILVCTLVFLAYGVHNSGNFVLFESPDLASRIISLFDTNLPYVKLKEHDFSVKVIIFLIFMAPLYFLKVVLESSLNPHYYTYNSRGETVTEEQIAHVFDLALTGNSSSIIIESQAVQNLLDLGFNQLQVDMIMADALGRANSKIDSDWEITGNYSLLAQGAQ